MGLTRSEVTVQLGAEAKSLSRFNTCGEGKNVAEAKVERYAREQNGKYLCNQMVGVRHWQNANFSVLSTLISTDIARKHNAA